MLRREIYPKPVDVFIEWEAIRNCVIAELSRIPIIVLRTDLLDALLPWLKGFIVGSCFDEDMDPIPSHKTVYTCDTILKRWGPGTRYGKCIECGRIRYKEPNFPAYYLRREVSDRPLFESQLCDLMVAPDVWSEIKEKKLPGLIARPVPIYDEPIDDTRLPGDPPDRAGGEPEPLDFTRRDRREWRDDENEARYR